MLFKTGQHLSYEELKHFQSQDPELAEVVIEENSSELWSCLPRQSFPFFFPWWVKDKGCDGCIYPVFRGTQALPVCVSRSLQVARLLKWRGKGVGYRCCPPADTDWIWAEYLCTKNGMLCTGTSCVAPLSRQKYPSDCSVLFFRPYINHLGCGLITCGNWFTFLVTSGRFSTLNINWEKVPWVLRNTEK